MFQELTTIAILLIKEWKKFYCEKNGDNSLNWENCTDYIYKKSRIKSEGINYYLTMMKFLDVPREVRSHLKEQ